jgi:hypothetical protein
LAPPESDLAIASKRSYGEIDNEVVSQIRKDVLAFNAMPGDCADHIEYAARECAKALERV